MIALLFGLLPISMSRQSLFFKAMSITRLILEAFGLFLAVELIAEFASYISWVFYLAGDKVRLCILKRIGLISAGSVIIIFWVLLRLRLGKCLCRVFNLARTSSMVSITALFSCVWVLFRAFMINCFCILCSLRRAEYEDLSLSIVLLPCLSADPKVSSMTDRDLTVARSLIGNRSRLLVALTCKKVSLGAVGDYFRLLSDNTFLCSFSYFFIGVIVEL